MSPTSANIVFKGANAAEITYMWFSRETLACLPVLPCGSYICPACDTYFVIWTVRCLVDMLAEDRL